ncbi:MAG: shikimate dehydrogenase [Bacteroidales bacterium]
MRAFGLIGKSLGHSFSAAWFKEYFAENTIAAEYNLYEIGQIESLPGFLQTHPDLEGFNITIPYKKAILPYCDEISAEVSEIGAANCIRVRNGKLTAYNTDTDGFQHMLNKLEGWDKLPGAMILGTGGAAAAAAWVFRKLHFPFIFISRSPYQPNAMEWTSVNAGTLREFPLIINATPLGMWPDEGSAPPLPYNLLTGREIIADMVYNPSETKMMKLAKQRGCQTINGTGMLYHQALKSWQIWNG